jgi:hypothetical protein
LSAVFGRASCLALFSFDGGEPAEMILDIEPETLWPMPRTVLDESLLTRERGRGMICTTSLNPTREFLNDLNGSLVIVSGSGFEDSAVACWRLGKGCDWYSRIPDGLVGAEPPICTLWVGFKIMLKSCEDKACDLL